MPHFHVTLPPPLFYYSQLCKKLKVPYTDDEETFCMFKAFQNKKTNTTGQLSEPEFKKFVESYLAIPKHLLKKLTEEEQLAPRSIDELERLFTLKIVTKYATVQKAWRAMDQDRDNSLSVPEFRTAFESMNMPLTDAIYKAVLARFDPQGKGYVTYPDFNNIIGSIIHPNAKDTSKAMLQMEEESGAQDGLYFVPTARLGTNAIDSVRKAKQLQKESVKLGDNAKAPLPSMESFPETVGGFRSPKSSTSGKGGAADSGFPGGRAEDAFSSSASATARLSGEPTSAAAPAAKPLPPVDVGKVEERMRKVLGRGWVHAAADIKKAASGSKAIPTEVLRDVLAEKGVPLTAREANALASRYSGSGGGVNVDGLLTQAFKATFAGASVPLAAAAAAAKPSATASAARSSTAALASSVKAVAAAAKGPPSAFSKQSIF
jgi:Ca2+-binding EF-hand superfamily protein